MATGALGAADPFGFFFLALSPAAGLDARGEGASFATMGFARGVELMCLVCASALTGEQQEPCFFEQEPCPNRGGQHGKRFIINIYYAMVYTIYILYKV